MTTEQITEKVHTRLLNEFLDGYILIGVTAGAKEPVARYCVGDGNDSEVINNMLNRLHASGGIPAPVPDVPGVPG